MIDTRQTLIKLHNKFPDFTLDTLFEILDCITEEIFYTYNWPWKDDRNTRTIPTINYGNPTCTTATNFESTQKRD